MKSLFNKLAAGSASFLLAFSTLLALPAAAFDSQPNDMEFKGDVILARKVWLGTQNTDANLLAVTPLQIGMAVSNASRSLTVTNLTVTNAQALVLSSYGADALNLTTAILNASNPLSAVASAGVGRSLRIFNSGTNVVRIVDAAPAYLAGGTNSAVLLGQYDSLTVFVLATNLIVQTSTSDN